MLRKIVATFFIISSTLTLAIAAAQPAAASNYDTGGCAGLFLEYASAQGETTRLVEYAQVRNICDPFYGRFVTAYGTSGFSDGPSPYQVSINRRLDIGDYVCAKILDTNGSRGVACTAVR